jgi:flagellar hook assembly protein FlgD
MGGQSVVKADTKLKILQVEVVNSTIYPPYDQKTTYFSVKVNFSGTAFKEVPLNVELIDGTGKKVKTFTKKIGFNSSDDVKFSWNGRLADGNLMPNGVYTLRFYLNGVEATEFAKSVTILTYPTAATPKVSNITSQSATLSWNKVPYATGYMIQLYIPEKKTFQGIKLVDANCTSFTYPYFMPATQNQFRVISLVSLTTLENSTYYEESVSQPVIFTTKNYITKKPVIKVKKASKKSIKISWKQNKSVKGYQVYMATSKKGKYKKIATLSKNSKISYVKKKLKRKKRYYFKVRSYVVISGHTFYSDYSAVKNLKLR